MGERTDLPHFTATEGNYPANGVNPRYNAMPALVRAQDVTMAEHVSHGQKMDAARSSFVKADVKKQRNLAASAVRNVPTATPESTAMSARIGLSA